MSKRRPPVFLPLLVLLGIVALLVERVIVTDAEAVTAVVEEAAEAVRSGEFDRLAATLDPAYQADGRDRAQAVAYLRRLWQGYRPMGLDEEVGEVQVDGDVATAPVDARVTVLARPLRVTLKVTCRRTDDGWKIVAAEPTGFWD